MRKWFTNLFEKLFDWMFDKAMSRQEGLTNTAYILAVDTRKRHLTGKEPEGPESMREAANFMINYARKRDRPIHHLAIDVYDEFDEPLPD